jgi:hypothetical protein
MIKRVYYLAHNSLPLTPILSQINQSISSCPVTFTSILILSSHTHLHPILSDLKKQSRYRPGVTQEGSRKLRFPQFLTTAHDGGKVVSLTHRAHLPPGNTSGTHFC